MEEITWKLEAALSSQTLAQQGVLALLHGGGADGSTTITDELGNTWTANGNAQIDTAQWAFRSIGSSIYFDGTGDYLSTADDAKWATIEWIHFRVMFATLPAASNHMFFLQQYATSDERLGLSLYNNAGTYQWRFAARTGGVNIISVITDTTILTNTWYDVILARSGNDWKVLQDGAQIGSTTTDADAIPNFAAILEIGRYGAGSYYFNGWLAEFCIGDTALKFANHTPASFPYAATAPVWTDITDDVLLMDNPIEFEDGIRSTSLIDLLASPGSINFTLDNSPANSGGKAGYYSPGHADCRAGFAKNIQIRFLVTYDGTTYSLGVYWLKKPIPSAGLFGEAVTICTASDWLEVMMNVPLPAIGVQASVRADELLDILLANVTTLPTSLDLDEGDSVFESALDADNVETDSVYSILAKICASEYGHIYLVQDTEGGGKLKFEHRNARLANTTSLGTISNTMDDAVVIDDAGQVFDRFQVSITPKRVDTSNVDLATLNYHLYIGPGETKTFTLQYTEQTSGNRISGKTIVTPVAGTDYKFGSTDDGSSQDLNASLTVTLSPAAGGSNSTDFNVVNSGSAGGYLNLFQLRGLGIYAFNPYTVEVGTGGLRVQKLTMPYQNNPNTADAVANYLQSAASDNERRGCRVKIHANKSAALMAAVIAGTVSTRWTLAETQTGLSGDFFINSRRWSIGMGGRLDVEWLLVPAGSSPAWVLDTSALDSTAVLVV